MFFCRITWYDCLDYDSIFLFFSWVGFLLDFYMALLAWWWVVGWLIESYDMDGRGMERRGKGWRYLSEKMDE